MTARRLPAARLGAGLALSLTCAVAALTGVAAPAGAEGPAPAAPPVVCQGAQLSVSASTTEVGGTLAVEGVCFTPRSTGLLTLIGPDGNTTQSVSSDESGTVVASVTAAAAGEYTVMVEVDGVQETAQFVAAPAEAPSEEQPTEDPTPPADDPEGGDVPADEPTDPAEPTEPTDDGTGSGSDVGSDAGSESGLSDGGDAGSDGSGTGADDEESSADEPTSDPTDEPTGIVISAPAPSVPGDSFEAPADEQDPAPREDLAATGFSAGPVAATAAIALIGGGAALWARRRLSR